MSRRTSAASPWLSPAEQGHSAYSNRRVLASGSSFCAWLVNPGPSVIADGSSVFDGLTVILFALGGGAYVSSRIPDHAVRLGGVVALALLCGVLVICGSLTSWLVREFCGQPHTGSRCGVGSRSRRHGSVHGHGLPAGIPAAAWRLELTPWLWGLNGATSVLASVLAVVIATASGISTSYWSGVATYVGAVLAFVVATAPRSAAPGA